jgi:hypothetical protein
MWRSFGVRKAAFKGCNALTAVSLPAVTSIGESAFFETETKALTVTLPAKAPALGAGSAPSGGYAKTVTVNRPAQSGGYNGPWLDAFKKLFGGGADITLNGNPKFFSFPFTSVTETQEYLAADSGSSPDNPILLQMQIHLTGGADELQRLFSAIHPSQKYIDLDLSRCTMNGTEFTLNTREATGKYLVVSLVLPDAAQRIPDDPPGDSPAFNHFWNLRSVSGRGIRHIGSFAFINRTALKEADFPNAANIGPAAFKY